MRKRAIRFTWWIREHKGTGDWYGLVVDQDGTITDLAGPLLNVDLGSAFEHAQWKDSEERLDWASGEAWETVYIEPGE